MASAWRVSNAKPKCSPDSIIRTSRPFTVWRSVTAPRPSSWSWSTGRRWRIGSRKDPFPLDDALPIAKQIAEALEAAHEQAIIHRDLKPANIKLRPDGMVKVLDFGLAKALEPAEVSPSVSQSPTITMPAITQAGVILGSAAYMAPEQAKGKPADKRCDVWAFGCVLYEMLTGHQVFGGEALAEIIGAVIHKEPDWTALAADTPPAIRTLLRRCLQKDRQQRIPDIGIARIELQDAISAAPSGRFLPASPARRNRERLAWLVAAVSSAVVVVLAAILGIREQPRDTRVYRASIPPVQEAPMIGVPPRRFALSPNGRHLVFAAGGPGAPVALWLRSLERGTVRRLAGTEGGGAPFWSPDSRHVAFIAQRRLKRIDIEGGPPVTLADVSEATAGGSWSKDNVIVFSTTLCGALFQIPAISDGAVGPATTLDPNAGDKCHWWPYFLPDGKHFLYQAVGSVSSKDDPRAVYIGSLDTGETSRLLLNGGSNAKYAQGHVLYMRESTLMAQPFDVRRLEFTGEPVPIAENVDIGGITGQGGAFSVSEIGALVYQTRVADPGSQLAWFDREGNQIRVVGDQAHYGDLELSPDATRAIVTLPRGVRTPRDIWIVDLLRGIRLPFTPDERFETAAVWSPNGSRIAFNGGHAGPRSSLNLYVKSSNGVGLEQVLVEDSMSKSPSSWSHNGQFLLFASRVTDSDSNLWVFPLSGNEKPFPYMQTTFNENGARFSPNDRWVAFGSNETGRPEIWVAPFPATGEKWPVSDRWGGDCQRAVAVRRSRAFLCHTRLDVNGRGNRRPSGANQDWGCHFAFQIADRARPRECLRCRTGRSAVSRQRRRASGWR